MPQLLEKIGVLAVLIGISTPASAATGISGRYRGSLGVLRVSTEARTGWITGQFESGGNCGYLPGQGVLEGQTEGNVFVGRVFLCQRGPSCESKFYPVMAVVDPDDGSLSAMLKLDDGCASPALNARGMLVLQPLEEGEDELATGPASAVQLARGKVDKKAAERAQRIFLQAVRAIYSKPPNYPQAKTLAQEAVSYNPGHWEAYLLLGVAEMKLGNPDAAIEAYKRSAMVNRTHADTHYNLACAYAHLHERERALESLKQAVGYGFDASDDMGVDPDLNAMFAGDPQFKLLAEQVAKIRAWFSNLLRRSRRLSNGGDFARTRFRATPRRRAARCPWSSPAADTGDAARPAHGGLHHRRSTPHRSA